MIKKQKTALRDVLVKEFMKPKGMNFDGLAEEIGISRWELDLNLAEEPVILCEDLAAVFGTTTEFWENLRRDSDG